ncbi:rRNA maturation RNase YbeY [Acidocella sp.]|uniref:rRNA maturation RNase YbeY n=1 Tax=Acidocella sp. TaxID=50710 RepID=UPI00262B149C|nr:rRNA maturation RNase YbeY [Acidocella sp.]
MEPGSSSPFGGVEIVITERLWRRFVPDAVRRVERALAAAECAASVALTDDRTIKRLNHRDRGKNKPTNVLTYERPPEILLAFGVVAREARKEHRSIASHLTHLIVHGALHLHGFDHHHPGQAREMEGEEARILARLGVPNPWKNR